MFAEDFIGSSALAIRAGVDSSLLKPIRKGHTREVAVLIAFEDIRFVVRGSRQSYAAIDA